MSREPLPGFRGQAPLPTGELPIERMTVAAKAETVRVADAAEAAKVIADRDHVELPKTKISLDPDSVLSFDKLSPADQDKYRDIIKAASDMLNAPLPDATPPPAITSPPDDVSAAPQEPSPTETRPHFCVNCGWDQAKTQVATLTEGDKKDWLRSLLSADRFRKRYPIYGGGIVLTLRNRTVDERDLILTQVAKRHSMQTMTGAEWLYWTDRYSAAVSLEKIEFPGGKTFEYPELIVDGRRTFDGKYDAAVYHGDVDYLDRAFVSQLSEPLHSALGGCYAHFEQLCYQLQARARSEDFFAGLDGGS